MANVTLRGHSLGIKAVIAKATSLEIPGDSERERGRGRERGTGREKDCRKRRKEKDLTGQSAS